MGKLLHRDREILRINPDDNAKLQYSTNDGRSWNQRYASSSATGDFDDLSDNGREILATTSKGLFYSTNEGRSWNRRSR